MDANQYHGKFYATSDMSKAVIVLTGSDGGHRWANDIAKVLSSNGVSAYALAYWGEKGLSKTLSLIPIEIIKEVTVELESAGLQKSWHLRSI